MPVIWKNLHEELAGNGRSFLTSSVQTSNIILCSLISLIYPRVKENPIAVVLIFLVLGNTQFRFVYVLRIREMLSYLSNHLICFRSGKKIFRSFASEGRSQLLTVVKNRRSGCFFFFSTA